jgi:hypothetical protein
VKKGGGGGGGGERGGEEGVGEGVAVERETGRQTTASRRGRRGQHTCITLAAPSRSQKKNTARIAAPLAAPSPYMRGVNYQVLYTFFLLIIKFYGFFVNYQVLSYFTVFVKLIN